MNIDEDTTTEEIAYLQAGKNFYLAIAGRDYETAFSLLSPRALTNVRSDQFIDESDEAHGKKVEPEHFDQLTKEQFLAGMKKIEQRYGEPLHINSLGVQECRSPGSRGQR